ncbi:MAG: hypothetical protein E7189_02130 [Erysipelotrichaceae bacterium]|nr:hypothetical protein [Erysipelotrichaceae bacterium]
MKQLLICVETRKQADTDGVYIRETIAKFFDIDNEVSVKTIYMGSKSKYNSNKVKNEITKKTKEYNGKTIIVYCIDTDNYDTDANDKRIVLARERGWS